MSNRRPCRPRIARAIAWLVLLAAAFFGPAAAVAAGASSADTIAGVWRTESGGYLQIYRDHDAWVGTIVGSADGAPRYDRNNPNKNKRTRRLLGVTILRGLAYEGDGEYAGGRIYDPDSGKTYKAKATMKGPDTLDARGYVGFSLFGKSQTWHRIDPGSTNVSQRVLHRPVGSPPKR